MPVSGGARCSGEASQRLISRDDRNEDPDDDDHDF